MADLASPLALMVRKLEIHTPLQPEDREALLSLPHTLKTYEPSSYLVREGEAPDQCAVLLSGFAFRSIFSICSSISPTTMFRR
jgi:CRP-like cAMP-binding protein